MKTPYCKGEVYIHILPKDKRISDGRVIELGKEYKATKKNLRAHYGDRAADQTTPIECIYGMHALNEGNKWIATGPSVGNWVCVVRLNTKFERTVNKTVALRRKVIAWKQVTTEEEANILRYQKANSGIVRWVFRYGETARANREMEPAS